MTAFLLTLLNATSLGHLTTPQKCCWMIEKISRSEHTFTFCVSDSALFSNWSDLLYFLQWSSVSTLDTSYYFSFWKKAQLLLLRIRVISKEVVSFHSEIRLCFHSLAHKENSLQSSQIFGQLGRSCFFTTFVQVQWWGRFLLRSVRYEYWNLHVEILKFAQRDALIFHNKKNNQRWLPQNPKPSMPRLRQD